MAENLQFYLDLYPDKKFICWGASGHFAKSTQKIENAELKEYKPMGSYIEEKYGDKAVVVGATGYKGQYGWEESLYNIPKAAENSFEELVHQTGYKTALVDLSQFKVADIFSKNEETLCKIDFKCKEISRRAFYRSFTGAIFINLNDYAITKIVSETLVDKERTLKKTKWELENLDKTWVIRKEVDYKKEGAHYFIHHTQYYDNYWLNEFADIYYFDFALKERPIEEDDYTYEKIKFSDNAYWQGIFNKIKK